MFERISYTWQLMKASATVLKRDKTLVLFPLISGIACIGVLLSFAAPLLFVNFSALRNSSGHLTPQQQVIGWVYLFAFYFVSYFVITFFNVGIVSSAVTSMCGGETSFAGGIRAALQRVHLIAGWALLSATVGVVLKIIESYNKKVGAFVADLIGAAWTIVTFMVVPVLVVENKGPIDAVKSSAALLKKTWGTQLIGNFSFGLIFTLLFLPGIAAIVIGVVLLASGSAAIAIPVFGLAVAYLIGLALIQSALHSIFQAAVYMYTQGVPDETHAFPVQLLQGAMGNG